MRKRSLHSPGGPNTGIDIDLKKESKLLDEESGEKIHSNRHEHIKKQNGRIIPLKPQLNAPTIKIISPSSGEKWQIGTDKKIVWTYPGEGKAEIILSNVDTGRSGDISIEDISLKDGTFNWEVGRVHGVNNYGNVYTRVESPGTRYKIFIKSKDVLSEGESEEFSLIKFVVDSPKAKEISLKKSRYDNPDSPMAPRGDLRGDLSVKWTSEGISGEIEIALIRYAKYHDPAFKKPGLDFAAGIGKTTTEKDDFHFYGDVIPNDQYYQYRLTATDGNDEFVAESPLFTIGEFFVDEPGQKGLEWRVCDKKRIEWHFSYNPLEWTTFEVDLYDSVTQKKIGSIPNRYRLGGNIPPDDQGKKIQAVSSCAVDWYVGVLLRGGYLSCPRRLSYYCA